MKAVFNSPPWPGRALQMGRFLLSFFFVRGGAYTVVIGRRFSNTVGQILYGTRGTLYHFSSITLKEHKLKDLELKKK